MDHKKMPLEMRAKQFLPFSALTGLEEALKEKEKNHEDKTFNQRHLDNNEIISILKRLINEETKQLQITFEIENGFKNIVCSSKEVILKKNLLFIYNSSINLDQIIQIKIIN